MELKILKERDNVLFKRKEILAEIQKNSTPSFSEVQDLISEKFKAQSENVKIKKIHGHFGSNLFEIIIFVYDSKEDREKFEKEKKIKQVAPAS